MPYARTSLSSMMIPNQNSVVFYCKTILWPCLSRTVCSHVCSRTSSCFGAYYRSLSPENLATLSRRFVLQSFLFGHVVWNIPFPTRFESQANMMVGTSPKNYDIGSSEVDAPSWKHYYCSILIKPFGHSPWGFRMTYSRSCSLWISCSRSPTFTWWPCWCFLSMTMEAGTSRRTLEAEC
jgi:hypothetical protein